MRVWQEACVYVYVYAPRLFAHRVDATAKPAVGTLASVFSKADALTSG